MSEARTYRNALPLGSMLLEYKLEAVLGAGGFGMTYLARDTNLEKHVAIKEYLPGDLSVRALDGSVVPVNTDHEYNYKWGLERFIQEARTLAKFSHANIVRVNRYFEANGTSYMVMDYEAGESLHQHLRRAPQPDEATLKNTLMPVLDGLQAVHEAGFLHRDIKPSNVFIRNSGSPVLLDFGAASMAGSGDSKRMARIVSPGYAPLEQYANHGNQGPWSDIYALSSVMYRAVTSENPVDAVSRMKSDDVAEVLARARTRYSERFLRSIEWGMMLDEKMRPQSIAEWRAVFLGRAPLTALNRGVFATTPAGVSMSSKANPMSAGAGETRPSSASSKRRTAETPSMWRSLSNWLIGGSVVLLVLAALGSAWSIRPNQIEQPETPATPSVLSTQPSAEKPLPPPIQR